MTSETKSQNTNRTLLRLEEKLIELGINICDNQELLKVIENQAKRINELEESLERIRKTYRLDFAGVQRGRVKPTDILSKDERIIYIIEDGVAKPYMIID